MNKNIAAVDILGKHRRKTSCLGRVFWLMCSAKLCAWICTAELLKQLPALQQLLFRVLGCQPQGAAVYNFVIQLALSMVTSESVKIYQVISDGTVNKFFERQRSDARRALDIYRRSGLQVNSCSSMLISSPSVNEEDFKLWGNLTLSFLQAARLSEFYEVCKSLDVKRGERFIKIKQPLSSFLQAMKNYVREAPHASTIHKDQVDKPKEVLAIEYNKTPRP